MGSTDHAMRAGQSHTLHRTHPTGLGPEHRRTSLDLEEPPTLKTPLSLHLTLLVAQSKEIMSLVELIGLGDGNKSSVGRLKNDVRRSVRKTFSPKTRDVLKHVEQRMGVRPRGSSFPVSTCTVRLTSAATAWRQRGGIPHIQTTISSEYLVCVFGPLSL